MSQDHRKLEKLPLLILFFLKKINEFVECADGFNVVATANTKGKGDDTGNFMGAGVLNEAFLERFPITIEQQYPTPSAERKISIFG